MTLLQRPLLPEWPEYGLIENLLPTLTDWAKLKKRVALATLVKVSGSSPRPVGSEMAISETGDVAGYISGGCVEAAITREALICLQENKPRLLEYGAGSPILDIQLTCGGHITILVRPIHNLPAHIQYLFKAQKNRKILTVATHFKTGMMRYIEGNILCPVSEFHRIHTPPIHLIIAGSDPVTLALCKLAQTMDIKTTLLRPLGPLTAPENFSQERYLRFPLLRALNDMVLDRWTAVYALTHDAETDLQLARHALVFKAFCVGILGSRSKIPTRLKALKKEGITEDAFKRLHLPAGLNIQAQNPMEIALSILAQIISARPREESL